MKVKLNLFAMLIIVLFTSSCSDEKITSSEDFQGVYETIYITNPLDSLGIIHNEILSEFVYNLEYSYLNDDFDGVTFPSNDFNTNIASSLNKAYDSTSYFSSSTQQLQEDLLDSLDLDNWFSSANYTAMFYDVEKILKDYASTQDSIFTINLINDIKDIIISGTSNDVFDELETIVNSHETLILAEDWDSTEVFALSALAVAKHSTQFWKSFFNTHLAKMSKNNKVQYSNGDKALVVGADAAGAVVGSIKGAIIGSVVSPVAGTIGGYFAGKIVGGVSASSTAIAVLAVRDLWADLFD
ncbi:MAG: hypothetical protein KDC55_08655 [Ignavibacteriae bacterium]|nr:hypothetical protein [Ignavibacteriota bacterium]